MEDSKLLQLFFQNRDFNELNQKKGIEMNRGAGEGDYFLYPQLFRHDDHWAHGDMLETVVHSRAPTVR